jgi:hypothetical protein
MTNPVCASIKIQDLAAISGAFGNASCPRIDCEIEMETMQLNALISHFLDIKLLTPSNKNLNNHTIILGYFVNPSNSKLFERLHGRNKIGVILKFFFNTSLSLFTAFKFVSGPIIIFVRLFSSSRLMGVDVSVNRFA